MSSVELCPQIGLLKIANGRVIDPATGRDEVTDLCIKHGKLVSPEGFTAEKVLDASGLIVCPGLVDTAVNLREPGDNQKGNIETETRAAAAGGITHLCCSPETQPVADNAAVIHLINDRAKQAGYGVVLPLGALTQELKGEQLSEMGALQNAGCIGVSNKRHPVGSALIMKRCLEYASTFNLTVFFNSEEPTLAEGSCAHDSLTASRLGLNGSPSVAETIALSRDLQLVAASGVRAHFGQISSATSVVMLANAQDQGLPVSADVAIHQLLFNDSCLQEFNSLYHVQPPFRSESDREALIAGVEQGVIQAICSDHQPWDEAAKQAPFAATESGISSVELLLPLILGLVESGKLSLIQALKAVTSGAASCLGVKAGHLTEGADLAITIFDAEEAWEPTEDTLLSAGKNTPFLGKALKGRVKHTLLGNKFTFGG